MEDIQIKLDPEHRSRSPLNGRARGRNWRNRGSTRGRNGHDRSNDIKRDSILNYYANGESTELKIESTWGKTSEQGSDERGPDERYRHRSFEDKINEKINSRSGPTYDLPPLDNAEKKFNGKNRLYIANTGPDVTEDEITELFKPYGEVKYIFINKEKNFSFVTFDNQHNAVRAKNDLDGKLFKNRSLKIRFSSSNATIKVKNLNPMVTNELLYHAFIPFGEIDEAKVSVDHYGKPTGEGFVHYTRKSAAFAAVKKCSEGCYFLTSSLQPVTVENFDFIDEYDGYSEKTINKKNPEYVRERENGPRFAQPNTFEYEYGQRWKDLLDLYEQKEKALKNKIKIEKEKLIAQMKYAKYEHETEVLRDTLRAREMDKERQKREWEFKQRQVEDEQARSADALRRYQDELQQRITSQREDMWRKQQENNMFHQAQNLDSLLKQTECDYNLTFEENTETNSRNEFVDIQKSGHWADESTGDFNYSKRRKF